MSKKKKGPGIRLTITLFLFVCLGINLSAQSPSRTGIDGKVYELDSRGKRIPLGYASVFFPDYGIGATTTDNGLFTLNNVPTGKARIQVQFVGKLPIDTLVNVHHDMTLDFTLKNEDFKLEEVVVTAINSQAGKSTASNISRQAMDHLQATSLNDLLALMPGGISQNSDLSSSQQINIRQISGNSSGEQALNALGTAIIRDGAPVSNNSNLSAMNPTVSGGASALGGGASPNGGVDVRSISTENIESVEIIRGIPSVEYGDLTSGAVIVNTKAGREPLRVKAKANPNVYQVSMGTGYELGKDKGAINVSADYAYNTSDPKATYQHYQRATGKLMYSNAFFEHKLRSNTSIDFIYGKDTREKNPDDESTQTTSEGQDVGFRLNTNGTWSINKGWLQTIRYVLSGSYTDKQSFYETAYGSASAPYSMTTTDGTILSNFAGQHIFDAEGNQITNFGSEDAKHYAVFLPSSYIGHYEIDSREVNAFAKFTTTLFKQ
ncbi:MAG: TonB-dependent receptor, partial [Bacteroidaceae bacterium]|nr:TonB-dependent receptor [Bacteroidaceae bacterium]